MEASVDPDRWRQGFGELMVMIGARFARVEPRRRAGAFLLGLLAGLPRANCWTIAEQAGEACPRGTQRLLSSAVIDTDGLRDDLRAYVIGYLGDPGAVLVNSQVAVYLVYAAPAGYAFIDRELYLPRTWTADLARCRAAGVPEDVEFVTKPALAKAMIARALDAGTPARWVAGDEVYGNDPKLRAAVASRAWGSSGDGATRPPPADATTSAAKPSPPDPQRETRWLPGRRRANVLPVASPGPHSALIIEVPEAEPAVTRHREQLDASAPLGIPAHITVLFPFKPPETISPAALAELEHLFAAVSRFRFQLDHTDWFGNDVLWLAPRDPAPFRALTQRVYQAFPAFPPFGGQFDDVIPHLTIGHGHPLKDLRTAEAAVHAHLPIDAHATAITLMTQQSTGGQWTKATAFTLG